MNLIFLGGQRPRLIKIPPMIMHGWKAPSQPGDRRQSAVACTTPLDEFNFWNCVLEEVWSRGMGDMMTG
ncbi:MAG: hypothetical protein U0Z44_03880 [Kouleothrix sp.]